MGVADFGVTGVGSTATGYEYSSTAFEGQAIVRSMSVTISGSSSKVTAFELNAVLQLHRNGTNYTYWIQNGLHLDASSHQYSIGGAYVWNFSSPGARLSTGELQGAPGSSLATDTFYYIPSCGASYPGQCSTLSLPSTLVGRIVSSTSGAVPYIDYEYNIGAGWVTYDNVSFLHMAGASDAGFVVDGFSTTPFGSGAYYDAEWVWVGAGGGSSSVDQSSDIDLSLSYWNGHNFQAISNAWDFGSNTGEASSNVTEVLSSSRAPGPSAHVVSGPGSLGVLYNQTEVGAVNITTPAGLNGTLIIDGVPVTFTDGGVNLTLPAGTHSMYLEDYSNSSATVSLAPGAMVAVDLTGAGRAGFVESGLPAGTAWGVRVNATLQTTTARELFFNLPNGSYPAAYVSVPGFYRVGPTPSSVNLPGPASYNVTFAAFTYQVPISETGLPPSTVWWVNANGTLVGGSATTLYVSEPNGSTPYEAGASYEFVASPSNGTLMVTNGVPVPVLIQFSYRTAYIQGTVSPSNATVSVSGLPQTVTGGFYSAQVVPGAYQVVVSAPGYLGQTVNVTTSAGNITWANVTLAVNVTQAPVSSSESGGSPIFILFAIVVVVAAGALGIGWIVLRSRRRSK